MHRGRVYKIVETANEDNVIYVGSTSDKMGSRWSRHKRELKQSANRKVYKDIDAVGGIDFVTPVVLEDRVFQDRDERRKLEQVYMDELTPSGNTNRAVRREGGVRNREGGVRNREAANKWRREYYQKNKAAMSACQRAFYHRNKDAVLARRKVRYMKNKTPKQNKLRHKSI